MGFGTCDWYPDSAGESNFFRGDLRFFSSGCLGCGFYQALRGLARGSPAHALLVGENPTQASERRGFAVEALEKLALEFVRGQPRRQRGEHHFAGGIEHECAHHKPLLAGAGHQPLPDHFGNFWRGVSHARLHSRVGPRRVQLSSAQCGRGRNRWRRDFSNCEAEGNACDNGFDHANASLPRGAGIGRPNDFAVAIHSLMMTSTFLSAVARVGPSAAQPGSSGTSAMKASSSLLQ